MAISEGDLLPETTFVTMDGADPVAKTTTDFFDGRNIALFGLPGAYTPVCHKEHLPGIIKLTDVLKENGIDEVACTAVNDIFVLDRWSRELGGDQIITMLADGNGEFAATTGLALDLSRYGLGIRSNRFAMLVANRTVTTLSIEVMHNDHDKSSAEALRASLKHAS